MTKQRIPVYYGLAPDLPVGLSDSQLSPAVIPVISAIFFWHPVRAHSKQMLSHCQNALPLVDVTLLEIVVPLALCPPLILRFESLATVQPFQSFICGIIDSALSTTFVGPTYHGHITDISATQLELLHPVNATRRLIFAVYVDLHPLNLLHSARLDIVCSKQSVLLEVLTKLPTLATTDPIRPTWIH